MLVSGAKILEIQALPHGDRAARLDIPGPMLISPQVFGDERGFVLETWRADRYAEFGISTRFVQDNLSHSPRGVLRGLHFQEPGGQAKLVSVVCGDVFDVAVDLRRGSPTFGRWAATRLTGLNHWQFYIPSGFAHGFCVLSEQAYLSYKCDSYYSPIAEHAVHWADQDLAIDWPVDAPRLSTKDRNAIRLRDLPSHKLPIYPP